MAAPLMVWERISGSFVDICRRRTLVCRLGHAGVDQCGPGAGQEPQRLAVVRAVIAVRAACHLAAGAVAEGAQHAVLRPPCRGGRSRYSPNASRMNSGWASAPLWMSAL